MAEHPTASSDKQCASGHPQSRWYSACEPCKADHPSKSTAKDHVEDDRLSSALKVVSGRVCASFYSRFMFAEDLAPAGLSNGFITRQHFHCVRDIPLCLSIVYEHPGLRTKAVTACGHSIHPRSVSTARSYNKHNAGLTIFAAIFTVNSKASIFSQSRIVRQPTICSLQQRLET